MIRIVPNTGIQYARLQDASPAELAAHSFQARRGSAFAAILPPEDRRSVGRGSTVPEDPAASRMRVRSADMSILLRLLEARPEGIWVPLPYEAGGLWVAAFLRRVAGEGADAVQVVIGIDTGLESDGNPDGLAPDELGERAPAPCAPRFWRQPATEAAARGLAAVAGTPASADDVQMALAGLADFLLRRGDARIVMERRPEAATAVGVDVVLDLGNSRTCALLKENLPGGRRERLELVYPDDPLRSEASPFSTQTAFVEHAILPDGCEETVAFRFLSMVKIGQGALDALARSNRDPRPLGISTAKRYLWEDFGGVEWEWRYANRVDERNASPVISGDVLRRMDPRSVFEPPAIPVVSSPDHPRVACMVWTVIELLEQAFRQVNSMEWRRSMSGAPRSECRRVLGNLVVTYPAGLHSVELDNYRRACEYAARLWSEFRSAPEAFCSGTEVVPDPEFGVQAPRVQMICDEGIAIQLCWLYGEAMHRFSANPEQLVEALGRRRGGVDTLRLASIDIGGGTVDLAIADYTVIHGLPAAAPFRCERLFHDSISRAGDDVLRGILDRAVFPAIVRQTRCGVERWNRVFAATAMPEDSVRELRRRLSRSAWVPVAMRCLAMMERGASDTVRFQIREACNEAGLLDRLGAALGLRAGSLPIGEVTVELDRATMRGIVRQTIGKTINQCADIVDQFDCDLLVVGGRPSGNPAIRDQIYAAMAVPPGQVVFLSELAVDDWYPFADGSGRIGDAKTCGVVGGAVAFEARYAMGAFVVELADRAEPAPIIGFLRDLNPANPPSFGDRQVLSFAPEAQAITFMPMQPLVLASRRVDDAMAEARPIYQVRLKQAFREALQRMPGVQRQVSVKFELEPRERLERAELGDLLRPSPQADLVRLRPGSVQGTIPRPRPDGQVQEVDAERCLELRACTLLDADGYWIDTGVFRPLEAEG